MTVRSAQLAVAVISDTSDHLLYTCPSGHRTIVKSIALLNAATAGTSRMVVEFITASSHFYLTTVLAAGQTAGESAELQPWIVLNAGDTIHISAAREPYTVGISGTELAL